MARTLIGWLAIVAIEVNGDRLFSGRDSYARNLDSHWAGNQIVMGGPISGGEILGQYPSVAIDGPDDIGRGGRIFPQTSVDEYFCELLRWFGVSNGDMDTVLRNIPNFYDPADTSHPLGFLA